MNAEVIRGIKMTTSSRGAGEAEDRKRRNKNDSQHPDTASGGGRGGAKGDSGAWGGGAEKVPIQPAGGNHHLSLWSRPTAGVPLASDAEADTAAQMLALALELGASTQLTNPRRFSDPGS